MLRHTQLSIQTQKASGNLWHKWLKLSTAIVLSANYGSDKWRGVQYFQPDSWWKCSRTYRHWHYCYRGKRNKTYLETLRLFEIHLCHRSFSWVAFSVCFDHLHRKFTCKQRLLFCHSSNQQSAFKLAKKHHSSVTTILLTQILSSHVLLLWISGFRFFWWLFLTQLTTSYRMYSLNKY